MNDTKLIFSLDIGSSKIVAMVGAVNSENVTIQGISSYYFSSNSKSNDFLSMSSGTICNLEFISSKIYDVINEARINADCSLGSVICNISGVNVKNIYSSSGLKLQNNLITSSIINDLISKSKQILLPKDNEIIDFEVQEYLINKEHYTINPSQIIANQIDCNVNYFVAESLQIANIKKAINLSGFDTIKLMPSGILSGMAVLNNEEKELGCALLDIGSSTTDVVVYENGFIRGITTLPFGGEVITRDIATVLKISRNLAEDIKLTYGACTYINSQNKNGNGISITDHRGNKSTISHKILVDVISYRIEEIFSLVNNYLQKNDFDTIINSGIVITGGTSLMPGILGFASQCFSSMPVRLGIPKYQGEFEEFTTNGRFATSIGALYFTKEYLLENDFAISTFKKPFSIKSLFERFRSWL